MDIVRSWKDPEYRAGLEDAPTHPSGEGLSRIEATGLGDIAGAGTNKTATIGCCGPMTPTYTWTLTSPVLCAVTLSVCP